MSKSTQDYLNLVTSEYKKQPNFNAMLSFMVAVPVQVQKLLDSMIPLFDLGTPPVGNQLDIIGQWVGVSRNIAVPVEGVYFSWDDVIADGWDFGIWQSIPPTANLIVLPDDVYLTLILARIAANHWDGTTEGAYAIWQFLFPSFVILIQDFNNMSYAVAIVGGIVDSLTLALLTGGYIDLRPEGVEITQYFVSIDANPAFAWDVENTHLAGWNEGSWLNTATP